MSKYTERTERYLLGKMSPEEQLAFENELKTNSELSDALEETSDLMTGIESHFNHELKLKLQEAERDQPKKARVIPLKKRKKPQWSIAAAITIILIACTYFLMSDESQSDELYAQYYSDYPNIIDLPQRDETSSLSEAFLHYQESDWQEADKAFQQLISSEPSLIYPHFYRAICQLNLNNPTQAVHELETVIQSGEGRFTDPANWYLALAYLRKGDTNSASSILENLATGVSGYATEAASLLNELK